MSFHNREISRVLLCRYSRVFSDCFPAWLTVTLFCLVPPRRIPCDRSELTELSRCFTFFWRERAVIAACGKRGKCALQLARAVEFGVPLPGEKLP